MGIFGSFSGGEFVSAMLLADHKKDAFSVAAVTLAFVCAAIALVLLAWMRRAVGPLRPGKARPHHR